MRTYANIYKEGALNPTQRQTFILPDIPVPVTIRLGETSHYYRQTIFNVSRLRVKANATQPPKTTHYIDILLDGETDAEFVIAPRPQSKCVLI